ncbi:malate dehydrogenase, NAD-dependent [Spinellus fusiger]|nr:malate dehydrogenase, NAD-dependent [Spinellus fusiger]
MVKVTVCGASGGIGQPLSLLLKQSDLITHLSLYDVVNTAGVAADLSHINTKSKVTGHSGPDQLEEAIKDSFIVVIPAGVPRKPGMTRDDLFKINGGIISGLATAAAKFCPKAFICVISNPVNSTVPIVTEVFKQHNVYDPRRIFGVTTLDLVRASTFVSELVGAEASQLRVPVVGGHSGATIVPLLSQVPGIGAVPQEQLAQVTHRIQYGGDEVVKAKDGAGSATLSMAFAGARFALSVLSAAIKGTSHLIEYTYVHLDADKEHSKAITDVVGEVDYFSVPVELGIQGVQKIHPLGTLSDYEKSLLGACTEELKGNIVKGTTFITESKL